MRHIDPPGILVAMTGLYDERVRLYAAGLFLAVALALGGAGPTYPLAGMIVGLAGTALGMYVLAAPLRMSSTLQVRLALALLCAALLLPLAQLVPLPPPVWSRLPGRALAAQMDGLAGFHEVWRPVSLDPEATRRAFLGLVPGAAAFLAALQMRNSQRTQLMAVVLAFAGMGVILGALQIAAGGGRSLTPFPSSHLGYAVGLFANRNHQAAFLLVAMVVAAAVAAARRHAPWNKRGETGPVLAFVALLALGVIATTSRMALLLVPIGAGGSVLILFHNRLRPKSLIAGAALLLFGSLLLSRTPLVQRVLERFSGDDLRFRIWHDTMWALPRYWPAGTGLGSFVPIYQSAEQLDTLGPAYVNHAHNDYLELALTGGLPALLLLGAFLLFLVFAAARLFRQELRPADRLIGLSALAAILILLLCSLVDYPLRTGAIGCVFGVLCAAVLPSPSRKKGPRKIRSSGLLVRRVLCLPAGLVIAWQVIAAGISAHAIADEDYSWARSVAPWSSDALSQQATEMFLHRQPDAGGVARKALAIAPLDVAAVRILALAEEEDGNKAGAARLMNIAGTLTWRDTLADLWLMQQAFDQGEPTAALDRADALLRRDILVAPLIGELHERMADPRFGAALAAKLAGSPPWRARFLALAGSGREQSDAEERLFVRLKSSRAPPTMIELRSFVKRLAGSGDSARAYRVWTEFVGSATPFDGGFERSAGVIAAGDGGPFEWRPVRRPGLLLSVEPASQGEQGQALHIRSDRPLPPLLLSQRLVLAPGSYSLSFRLRGTANGSGWEVACLGERSILLSADTAAEAAQNQPGWFFTKRAFHVPNGHCAIQELRLRSTQATDRATDIWIDEVRATRL